MKQMDQGFVHTAMKFTFLCCWVSLPSINLSHRSDSLTATYITGTR